MGKNGRTLVRGRSWFLLRRHFPGIYSVYDFLPKLCFVFFGPVPSFTIEPKFTLLFMLSVAMDTMLLEESLWIIGTRKRGKQSHRCEAEDWVMHNQDKPVKVPLLRLK